MLEGVACWFGLGIMLIIIHVLWGSVCACISLSHTQKFLLYIQISASWFFLVYTGLQKCGEFLDNLKRQRYKNMQLSGSLVNHETGFFIMDVFTFENIFTMESIPYRKINPIRLIGRKSFCKYFYMEIDINLFEE